MHFHNQFIGKENNHNNSEANKTLKESFLESEENKNKFIIQCINLCCVRSNID